MGLDYAKTIEKWDVLEATISGPNEGNPFCDQWIKGTFCCKNEKKTVDGFYDGDGIYKVRFMPSFTDEYTFEIEASFDINAGEDVPDKEVPEYKLGTADGGKAAEKCAVRNILTGIFTVIPPSADNHGPVRVAGTYYLVYEDGTPYHCIGTTCYVWNLQNEELQKQTLKTLEENAFNKIRFCIFPKHYDYNLHEPITYPYEGTPCDSTVLNENNFAEYNGCAPGNDWDFTRFNPAHFQHIEKCIQALMNLGIESTALGFTAGFTGDEIIRRLEEMGVRNGFIQVGEGFSRINLKLKSIDGTEINGQGPKIGTDKVDLLMKQLGELGQGDVLFLSGSIPSSMPDDAYQKIMAMLDGRGVRIAVDATRDLLMKVLPYHPFLIKPNNHELGEIFGVELKDRQSVIPYGKKLQKMGAVNVLISMAGEGAVLIAENGDVYEEPAPKGKLINGVGAGDSMVAGFMAGYMEKQDYEYAFHMGIAAGSASAFSENLATREEIEAVYQQITGKDQEERKK